MRTCGHARPAYKSCRKRHCPKCEALLAARWIDARMARLLPIPYFHVVFTLPAALRGLVLHNRRRLFALLLLAALKRLRPSEDADDEHEHEREHARELHD